MKNSLETGNAVLQTIHASEGNRALKLLRQRQKLQKEVEQAKVDIEKQSLKKRIEPIDSRYQGSVAEVFEEKFKHDTVGLVTAEQFKERRKRLAEQIEDSRTASGQDEKNTPIPKTKSSKKQVGKLSKLSFDIPTFQDETINRNHLGKDPSIDTSFLSDAAREEQLQAEREKLKQEYMKEQERIKAQLLELSYMYWDGVGEKKTIRVQKNTTVATLIGHCRRQLAYEIPAVRGVSVENLLYVKDGIILPGTVTFYELLRQKANGQSGPLFTLAEQKEASDDSTLQTSYDKDEGCVGKIVDKNWYEKNKHIFPASSWETYTLGRPYKARYETLTL